MRAIAAAASSTRHAACSGCGLCLLVCPVWRRSRDLVLTPHGRAKALQNGVGVDALADSADSCTLCGACRPVCPEQIDPVDMVIESRRQLPRPARLSALLESREAAPSLQTAARRVFLPDAGLRDQPGLLRKVMALLGTETVVGADAGIDIALALEAGALLPQRRLERFLAPLHGSKTIIVADGLLCRYLARWLPRAAIVSLGQALSSHAGVRRGLRATDLYVIEPRAYHADYQRLVRHYDRLCRECGCDLNLDLQRIVVPATARSLSHRLGAIAPDDAAQIGWLLQGRKMNRIVAENCEDYLALTQVAHCEVVHLADLKVDENHAYG